MSAGAEGQDVTVGKGVVSRVVVWVVFALLYAYPLFEGISNLIALPPYYAANGIGAAIPWWLLIAGVVAPVLLYLSALWIGRGRELFPRTLLLAVGLATANALVLSAVSWASAVQPALS